MGSECWCKWTRRALPSRRYAQALGEGRGFALHRGSWMSVPVPMVVFSPFVEVLVAQGVVHVIGHGTQALELHLLLLFGSLWSVVRTVALRSAMHEVDTVGVGAPAPWRTAR